MLWRPDLSRCSLMDWCYQQLARYLTRTPHCFPRSTAFHLSRRSTQQLTGRLLHTTVAAERMVRVMLAVERRGRIRLIARLDGS